MKSPLVRRVILFYCNTFLCVYTAAIISLISCFLSCNNKSCYYLYVNKAESEILDSNYAVANKYYKKAFKARHPGFSDHYFNAYRISIFENDINFATFNAQKLIERGLCLDFFSTYPQVRNDSVTWRNIKNSIKNQDKINYKYKLDLEAMIQDDQEVSRENREVAAIEFMKIYEKFKILINKNGYPSESLIGISCTPNLKGFYTPPQDLLLFHFMQYGFSGVDSILKNALVRNLINPYTYADIICRDTNQYNYCIEPIVMIDDSLYTPKICSLNRAAIDKARKKIGLPSIETETKTILFKISNPDNGFRLSGNLAIYSGFPNNLKNKFFDLYPK